MYYCYILGFDEYDIRPEEIESKKKLEKHGIKF